MKYVPNMIKICKHCHEVIKYGEKYVCTETLDMHNDIIVDAAHQRCDFGGYGIGVAPLSGGGGGGGGGGIVQPKPWAPNPPWGSGTGIGVGGSGWNIYTDNTSKQSNAISKSPSTGTSDSLTYKATNSYNSNLTQAVKDLKDLIDKVRRKNGEKIT